MTWISTLKNKNSMMMILAATLLFAPATAQRPPSGSRTTEEVIRLQTDGFWLNLHHFLYVLGRAEAGMPDATREAVRHAPADQDSVLARLSPDDRSAWRATVSSYATGLSRRDLLFDAPLLRVTERLSRARPEESAAEMGLEPAMAEMLDRAGAIYRAAWWPRHRAVNQTRAAELRPLLASHGAQLADFASRVYDTPWPTGGFTVHLSAFTNWAGAYSVTGSVILASSSDPAQSGWLGVETLVHESLHQWDQIVQARVNGAARAAGVPAPPYDVVHGMIFATAGEAVRRIIPDHVPYAEALGLWRSRQLAPHRERIDAAWRPWLRGEGTLDSALAGVVRGDQPQ